MRLGVLFDLDGTLVTWHGSWAAWTQELRADCGVPTEGGARFDAALGEALRSSGHVTLAGACASALAAVGLAPGAGLEEAAARARARYALEARVHAAALPLLEGLAAAGVGVAIVTNGPEDMQHAVLRETGLAPRADAVIVSGAADVAVRKPHPKVFWLACTALRSRPADTLMVGDDLAADVLGAHRFGLATCWIAPAGADPAAAPAASVVVDSLAAAGAVVREFVAL